MHDDRYPIAFQLYPYQHSPDQDASPPQRHPVVVVGGGPIGMAVALDLGQRGTPVVVLDDHEGAGQGSRAICFSKRALEIADRLGCGQAMLDKGVVWSLGKVFHDDRLLYEFNLQPEEGHKIPAFINLQQPYFEKFIVDHIRVEQARGTPIEIRGRNRVEAIEVLEDGVAIDISTPDGPYRIEADWLIACDGARSPVRDMLGLDFAGRVFEDNFLIADVKMEADFPTERWFWFDPHFKSGDSALLHKQPDDIWRIDFQLGWDIDRKAELKVENIRRRVDAMLGPEAKYELEWCSIYTFQCRRMERFRHGRVLFAGDAAHQVSPFGARGANSGIQDAENLAWKLDMVIRGTAPDSLLDSYCAERRYAADENILNSTRATDFITPKSEISRLFRDATLKLAEKFDFARAMVNSGRLSVPAIYDGSGLNSHDELQGGPARSRPGSPCSDLKTDRGYLLEQLHNGFSLLAIDLPDMPHILPYPLLSLTTKNTPHLAERYLGTARSAIYLIRPDQHVAGRWQSYDADKIEAAVARATCRASGEAK